MNSSTTEPFRGAETVAPPAMLDAQCAHLSKVLPQDGDLFTPYVVNCVIMSVLSGTAVLGNVLILVSLFRAPQFLRQPSYFLLLNLAFADLCVGFVAEPLYLIYKISYLLNPFTILSCYAGVVFNFFSYLLTSLSLWTAAAISLDRLLALHLHMKYSAIVTKRKIFLLIAVLFVLSFAFASMFQWALNEQNTVFVCVNSLALLVALLSYVRIFQIMCYHQRQISNHQLGEISITDRGETDSVGTSFHGHEMREQLKEAATDDDGNDGAVDGKTETKAAREIEHTSHRLQLQEKAKSPSSRREGMEHHQLHIETKIAPSKNQSRIDEQPEDLKNVIIKENTSKFVKSTQKSHSFDSSGVTEPKQIDIAVIGNMYRGTELKRVASEIVDGSAELRTNEGSRNLLEEKSSSGSCQEKQVSNSGLVMTEMQVMKLLHEDQNNAGKKTRKGFKMRHFKKSFYNMVVIWFLMLLCYLPGICTSMVFILMGRSYAMHLAFTFTTSVMFLNSSINPIVFCWRIREFRAAVKKTLKDVFGIWSSQSSPQINIGGS